MCVSVSPLQCSFICGKEKRDVCGQYKADKEGENENHWVLCSSHTAPTERSLTAAELFHAPTPTLSFSPSLPLSLSSCHG